MRFIEPFCHGTIHLTSELQLPNYPFDNHIYIISYLKRHIPGKE
jgi:hypothetical protein